MQRKERKASETTLSLVKDSLYQEVEENDAPRGRFWGHSKVFFLVPMKNIVVTEKTGRRSTQMKSDPSCFGPNPSGMRVMVMNDETNR
jgi:hypothetical protein